MKTFVEIDVVDVQETSLRYHVGLPAEVRIDELKQILKLYEKYGFKEELFTKIAEENGHDLDDYSYNGGYTVNNETTRFIEKYEKIVNGKRVTLCKKINVEEF